MNDDDAEEGGTPCEDRRAALGIARSLDAELKTNWQHRHRTGANDGGDDEQGRRVIGTNWRAPVQPTLRGKK